MALAIDASTPAAYKGNIAATSVILNPFTPPVNSQIWVFVGWDSNAGAVFGVSSSPALTWNTVSQPDPIAGSAGAGVFYANVSTSQAYTLTVTSTSGPFSGQTVYPLVITGAETTWGGALKRWGLSAASNPYLSNTVSGAPGNIVATATGSMFFGICTDWNGVAFASAQLRIGANQTYIDDHDEGSNYASAIFRSTGTLTSGNSYDAGFDSSKTNFTLQVVEIRPGGPAAPILTAELWENGSLKQSLGTYSVNAEGIASFPWDAASLSSLAGTNVELRISADADTDIGAIEWQAVTEYVTVIPLIESWGLILI
jgi:hypothetical protein